MQGTSWLALLARIPPEQTENLLMITNNGTGIAVKGIVRAEDEYVIVRGRLMGTVEEGGGFFFVPYDQINYLGFQTAVKETVIHAMYEGQPANLVAGTRQKTPDGTAETAASPGHAPTPPPVTAPASGSAHPPGAAPGKAALLERLRARRGSSDMPKPNL
jgi:hypothetical protein